ncbi:hypothetical protein [Streptomyces virginiae]|uniref:hypothetical protein n=1 Tax=Streptomyces virginiae TaxID=1961 RepID=UPI002253A07E|nr:hypothetical protein [Streptomyces virginiae]MCX4961016.1 hypothetical protein [Streptomyces virginiae]
MLTIGDPGEPTEPYGVDAPAYDEMVDRLGDPERPRPVLRLRFDGGHTAYAVHADEEDENNVEFFVRHPRWGRLGHLCRCGADDALPSLSGPGPGHRPRCDAGRMTAARASSRAVRRRRGRPAVGSGAGLTVVRGPGPPSASAT